VLLWPLARSPETDLAFDAVAAYAAQARPLALPHGFVTRRVLSSTRLTSLRSFPSDFQHFPRLSCTSPMSPNNWVEDPRRRDRVMPPPSAFGQGSRKAEALGPTAGPARASVGAEPLKRGCLGDGRDDEERPTSTRNNRPKFRLFEGEVVLNFGCNAHELIFCFIQSRCMRRSPVYRILHSGVHKGGLVKGV